MKRLAVFLFVFLLLPALCLAAADDEIIACLRQAYPGLSEAVTAQCGDAAAAALEDGGVKTLCLLEKQNGAWRITLSNPAALHQDRALPALTMESANALSWTYETSVYSAARDETGWSAVQQTVTDESLRTEIRWHDGRIHKTQTLLETGEVYSLAFPAQWLEGCIRLAEFDVSRFPVYEYEEYNGQWPDRPFIAGAAAALMPGYTFQGGALDARHLTFLMERPDGARVYVGCYETTADGGETYTPQLIESTPLPADTYYGVENFTTSLYVNGLCVTLCCNESDSAPGWGVSLIDFYEGEGESCSLALGPQYVSDYSSYAPRACFGNHPWSDITTIDWSALPRSFEAAVAAMNADGYAVVSNPDPADRLNLRAEPDRNSASLGKYYSDTPVKILSIEGDWAHVDCFGRQGWMMKKFLRFTQPYTITLSAMPYLEGSGDSLTLYAVPDTHAAAAVRPLVSGYGMYAAGVIGEEFYHVWFPLTGVSGFVLQSDASQGNG